MFDKSNITGLNRKHTVKVRQKPNKNVKKYIKDEYNK
jgi:hypothetical protein